MTDRLADIGQTGKLSVHYSKIGPKKKCCQNVSVYNGSTALLTKSILHKRSSTVIVLITQANCDEFYYVNLFLAAV